jgi:ferredoxin
MGAEEVKALARRAGADLAGIASMDRFEGAPPQMDPRHIFPDAKSAIVIGVRILRGVLRGVEEGTHFISYPAMGYAGINWVRMPMLLWEFCARLEDSGYEAVPIPNIDYWTNANLHSRVNGQGSQYRPEWSRPVAPGRPAPDVFPNLRIAAFAAGLGELGWSRMLLTPQFGPRQRLMMVLTDAPLEPDPLYAGPQLCDRCMLCVKDCAGCALSRTASEKFTVAGREIEWSALDYDKCLHGMSGGLQYRPFQATLKPVYEYGAAVEGARGCMRACMIHLEQQGKLANRFHHVFRRRPAWRLEPLKEGTGPGGDRPVHPVRREFGEEGTIISNGVKRPRSSRAGRKVES